MRRLSFIISLFLQGVVAVGAGLSHACCELLRAISAYVTMSLTDEHIEERDVLVTVFISTRRAGFQERTNLMCLVSKLLQAPTSKLAVARPSTTDTSSQVFFHLHKRSIAPEDRTST